MAVSPANRGPVITVLLCMHASVPAPAYRHTCSGGAVAKCVPSRCSERAAAGRRAGRRRRRRGIDKWPRVCLSGNTTKAYVWSHEQRHMEPLVAKSSAPIKLSSTVSNSGTGMCVCSGTKTYFICLFISVCLFISGDRVYDDLDGGVWITVECSMMQSLR